VAAAPDAGARVGRGWHAAALAILCAGAWLHMRGWLDSGLLPPGDFAGYAAVVEQVRDALLRYGRVPDWCSACFGGSSRIASSLKETLAFPLALWLDSVSATKALFAIARLVSAFLVYWLLAFRLTAPAAGIAAGYVFAFGASSNHQVHVLDVPVSAALLAAVPLAALPLLERGSWRAAVLLGWLAACLLSNDWMQALVALVLFVLVGAVVCRVAWRARLRPLGIALATCLAFGSSWLAWTLADGGNHQLVDPEAANEQPYLGAIAIAIVIAGALATRREPELRRWLAAGALLMLFQYAIALPSWQTLSGALPLFAWPRSPGHFMDLLPLGFSLAVGASLAALALLIAVGAWPSRRTFDDGARLDAILAALHLVASLPGEDGSLRLQLVPPDPDTSLIAAGSQLGQARDWLGWQAGSGWLSYVNRACWPFHPERKASAPPPPGHARLLEIARIRYLLVWDRDASRPPPPWVRVGGTPHASLWEQPHVGPIAQGYRALALAAGGRHGAALPLVAPLHERNVLVASVGELGAYPDLADSAVLLFRSGDAGVGDASDRIAERHAGKLFDLATATSDARWTAALPGGPPPATFDVLYERSAPEHVRIALDAGRAPAYVFVSEGYHPWWRARVDAAPTPVLRAYGAFMAVPVPAHAREVELRFTPPLPVRAADAVTALAWLAAPVGALVMAAQRVRARGSSTPRAPDPRDPPPGSGISS
jgi:hypothetical protein